MNPYAKAHQAAKTLATLLQESLAQTGPVESLLILPMIERAVKLQNDIAALRKAAA